MQSRWLKSLALRLLLTSLVLAACGTPDSKDQAQESPPATAAHRQLATDVATVVLAATPTATAMALPTATSSPLELVVLHTNDNWGETEPCG